MKFILKVLFAGFVALVVLLAFVAILIRGCAAGLDQPTKEIQQERYPQQRKSTFGVNEMVRWLEKEDKRREQEQRELEQSIDEQLKRHDPNKGIFWPSIYPEKP